MRTVSTIYPSLGRYYSTIQDIADAACISRTQAWRCLTGKRKFTEKQKRAIANDIVVRFYAGEIKGTGRANEIDELLEARNNFDEIFMVS